MTAIKAFLIFTSLFFIFQASGAAGTMTAFQSSIISSPYSYAIFNGTAYVSTGGHGLPTLSSSRSVFAWVYQTGEGTIYSYGLNGNDQMASLYINSNNQLAFLAISNAAQSSLTVSPNAWHLVGYTYMSNSNTITFYLDGTNQTVPLSGGKLNTSVYAQSSIGKLANCNGPCSNFIGWMENVRVYRTFVPESSVESLYLAGPILGKQILYQNLSAWWPLNGSTLDYSGNGNGGSYYHLSYGTYQASKALSIIATSGGRAIPSSSGAVYPVGANISITALPSIGYSFENWSGSGIGSYTGRNPNITIRMNDNITELATFGLSGYLLIALASPSSSGRVAIDANASSYHITSQEQEFGYGQNATLSESPNPGSAFVNWSCTGSGCYSGRNPDPNVVLYNNITEIANFGKAPQHVSLVTTATAGGSASGSGVFLLGEPANISAAATPGNVFVKWTCTGSGCYSGASPFAMINMTGNFTETANFESVQSESIPISAQNYTWVYYVIVILIIIFLILTHVHIRKHRKRKRRTVKPKANARI